MSHVATGSVARQLETLFAGGSAAGLSDRQLLERFAAARDEAAFAALVDRHGPMVLGVCRQLLGDAQHAEDAFQATFLVLARRAPSIRDPELLGNWLYGVATRTARCVRQQVARRRRREEDHHMSGPGAVSCHPAEPTAPPADVPAIDREQAEALHGEVDRLPKAFRLPVVLCYFEGLTLDEAARRLRCPAGTVRSRLARAREKLRNGLARRGIVLSSAALGAVLAPRSASASVPPLLCETTSRAAIAFAARHAAAGGAISVPAAALAQEVLRTMLIHRLRTVLMGVLALAAIATGAGYLTHSSGASPRHRQGAPDERAARTGPRPPAEIGRGPADRDADRTAPPSPDPSRPAPGRMFVVGRVLDPDGKPVPNATVAVYGRNLAPGRTPTTRFLRPIGDARTDGSGRFRVDAPRTSSAQYEDCGVVALAPGFGAGWADLDPDDERPSADIALRPEQVIQGRIFDVQGRPAAGVTVSVNSIFRDPPRPLIPLAERRGRPEGVFYGATTVNDFPAWPRPAITDSDGRFAVRGVGRGLHASLSAHHPQFALESIPVATDDASKAKPVTAALPPAQVIQVRVTYADTGRPVPHSALRVTAARTIGGRRVMALDESETGADGRARVNSWMTDGAYNIWAQPPGGEPYLPAHGRIIWPKGAQEQSLDLALPRGVPVRGKVTEEGTGRPVAGATVDFVPREERQNIGVGSPVVSTASDGSFRFGAEAGPGILFVRGPDDDYVLQAVGIRMLSPAQPGGLRVYTHAHAPLDLKPGDDGEEVNLVLRRGATVTGRVVGPDGRPVREAAIITPLIIGPRPSTWASWAGRYQGRVRDGRFELRGLDPNAEVPVYFLEPKGKLGTVVKLSAKSAAGKPITVRLEPCGAARGRAVDPAGKPVAGALRDLVVVMVVTPGPTRSPAANDGPGSGLLFADEGGLAAIDPINYEKDPAPGADGRLVLPVLIPGASYRIIDYTTAVRGQTGPAVRKEFTVKPGETLDLGDIRIEKPGG